MNKPEITWGQDKTEFQEVNSVPEKSLELLPSFGLLCSRLLRNVMLRTGTCYQAVA